MSYKIYAPDGFGKYFERKTRKQIIKSGLPIENVAGGVIAVDQQTRAYGVFTKDFKFVKSSLQKRNQDGQFIPKIARQKDIPFIDADALYLGNVYPQFGHFLLEHMNRAWGLLDDRYGNAKVVLVRNKKCDVPEWMYALVEMIGVRRDDIIVLDRTTRFRSVIVPAQGFNIPVYSSREYQTAFDKMAARASAPDVVHEKIYLSRAALSPRRIHGEEKIQRIFEKNGFYIAYPEKMPLREQVSLMKNCKVLAGLAGTALHLALFMPAGGRVIQIKRNRRNKCNAPIQYLINKNKNIDSVFIWASLEKYKTDHGTLGLQIVGVTRYMREFFRDFGFECSQEDLCPDVAEWNRYKDALAAYKKEKGGMLANDVKRLAIKLSACAVPGRMRRGRFRKWMKRRLKVE
ncbi:MAG: glycosyltransferase family 61 protein [Rickettsiales bacterium]|jgi:capsular polysaccharide biosynthesis protein|nr:glycosyltransferase family 61 protein [Rickettsiales bacterium]